MMPTPTTRPDFGRLLALSPSPEVWEAMEEWLMSMVVVCPSGCWIWIGADSGSDGRGAGYSKIKLPNSRKTVYLHRLVYQIMVGPIPFGKQIDHMCKNWQHTWPFAHRRCINPYHLEPVTQSDNQKRNVLYAQTFGGIVCQ